jgi:hypothetical protein
MADIGKSQKWLGSREARAKLKVGAWDLMHLLVEGKLWHQEKGNAHVCGSGDNPAASEATGSRSGGGLDDEGKNTD